MVERTIFDRPVAYDALFRLRHNLRQSIMCRKLADTSTVHIANFVRSLCVRQNLPFGDAALRQDNDASCARSKGMRGMEGLSVYGTHNVTKLCTWISFFIFLRVYVLAVLLMCSEAATIKCTCTCIRAKMWLAAY